MARICDRCGLDRIAVKLKDQVLEQEYDLCRDCGEEFQKFLKSAKAEITKKEDG